MPFYDELVVKYNHFMIENGKNVQTGRTDVHKNQIQTEISGHFVMVINQRVKTLICRTD